MKRSLLLFTVLAGCAPRLEPRPFDAGTPVNAGELDGGQLTSQSLFDGGRSLVVDATSGARWVHFDFDTAREVAEGEPGWDVAFLRFSIKTNGGISGDGGVEVARLDAGTLDEVTAAPPGPWLVDAEDGDDEGTTADFAFLQEEAWYAYDSRYHTLTPRRFVYVVRSTQRELFRVRLRGYYDAAGTSGVMSLDWSALK